MQVDIIFPPQLFLSLKDYSISYFIDSITIFIDRLLHSTFLLVFKELTMIRKFAP